MSAPDEERVSRIARALLDMADRANTARGASWEHGARSAGTLTDAAALFGELRAEVERLTSERDAALADAAKLRGVLRGLVRLWNEGGLCLTEVGYIATRADELGITTDD